MASNTLSPSQARQSGEASGTPQKYGHCEQDRCAVFLEELVAVATSAGGPQGQELVQRMRDMCRHIATRVRDSILMAHLSSTLLVRITLDMKGKCPFLFHVRLADKLPEKPRRTIDEAIASFVAANLKLWDHFFFGVAERPPNARLRIAHISTLDPFLGACDEPGVREFIERPIHACHPLKYREALMDPEMAKVVQSKVYLDFVLENEAQVDQRSAAILSETFKSLRQDQLSEQKLAMAIEAYRVSKDSVSPLVRRVCQVELLSASALCHDDLSERMNSMRHSLPPSSPVFADE